MYGLGNRRCIHLCYGEKTGRNMGKKAGKGELENIRMRIYRLGH